MKNEVKFGFLDTTSSKDIRLMEKMLEEKYQNSKKEKLSKNTVTNV